MGLHPKAGPVASCLGTSGPALISHLQPCAVSILDLQVPQEGLVVDPSTSLVFVGLLLPAQVEVECVTVINSSF